MKWPLIHPYTRLLVVAPHTQSLTWSYCQVLYDRQKTKSCPKLSIIFKPVMVTGRSLAHFTSLKPCSLNLLFLSVGISPRPLSQNLQNPFSSSKQKKIKFTKKKNIYRNRCSSLSQQMLWFRNPNQFDLTRNNHFHIFPLLAYLTYEKSKTLF